MKALFVNPHPGRREPVVYPLGLAYAAAAARSAADVRCLDLQLEAAPVERLADEVRTFDPDAVGVSIRNVDASASYDLYDYMPVMERTVAAIRAASARARIVAGGPGFTLFPEAIMRRIPAIDIGLLFEAEYTLPELLRRLEKPDDVPHLCLRGVDGPRRTAARAPVAATDLDAPAHDLLPLRAYAAAHAEVGVQTRRGCALRCVYCTYPFLDGGAVRVRPPGAVGDELERLADSGVRRVFFCDSIFNNPSGHAEAVCREILKRGLRLQWRAFFNEAFVDREQVRLAREAGCVTLIFGPDGGTDRMLGSYRKNMTAATLRAAYAACRAEKAAYRCSFLMNGPGETWGSLLRTFALILRCRLRSRMAFALSTIRIYPHTELHRMAVAAGALSRDDDLLTPRYYNPCPLRPVAALVSALERAVVRASEKKVCSLLKWKRPCRYLSGA